MQQETRPVKTSAIIPLRLMIINFVCCCRKDHAQVLETSSWAEHGLEMGLEMAWVSVRNSMPLLHSGSCGRQPLEGSRGHSAEKWARVDVGEVRLTRLSLHILVGEKFRPLVTSQKDRIKTPMNVTELQNKYMSTQGWKYKLPKKETIQLGKKEFFLERFL